MTAILFRGGMCGDLILGMIDPNAVKKKTGYNDKITDSTINNYRFKPARYIMKKFHLYDDNYKKSYDQKLKDIYYLTHDTDFCLNKFNKVIQLISSPSMHLKFAQRFATIYKHRPHVIAEAYSHIKQNSNFVDDYASSLTEWQRAFKFEQQYDVSDMLEPNFVEKTLEYFEVDNFDWANQIYNDWIKENKFYD
tara:strand:- start:304 stop:882 length:579 start_codon:yes stop_codon:yes gene_type:complete